MRAIKILPEGYSKIFSVDLQKDKKKAILVNVISLIIMVIMFLVMNQYRPISEVFELGLKNVNFRFLAFLIFSVIYVILHELVHGITMKFFGTDKVKYGFTGLYAFAGSDYYYDKKSYIIIALAPVIVFFFIFLILGFIVPDSWFWVVYLLQIANLSGASGDYYVTYKFSKLPKDILVRDYGVSMEVFSREV